MLRNALEFLQERFDAGTIPFDRIHQTKNWNRIRDRKSGETTTLRRHDFEFVKRFESLPSFCEWVNANKGDIKEVFLSREKGMVQASIDEAEPETREGVVSLAPSDEWIALKSARRLSQKDFLRLLLVDLDGAYDPTIAAAIASLNFKSIQDSSVRIQHIGLTSSKRSREIEITHMDDGEKKQTLPLVIQFDIPIHACLTTWTHPVEAILVIEEDNGDLVFSLDVRRVGRVMTAADKAVVDLLNAEFSTIPVYVGSYKYL